MRTLARSQQKDNNETNDGREMESGELLGHVSNVTPISAHEAFYSLGHQMKVRIPRFLLLACVEGRG